MPPQRTSFPYFALHMIAVTGWATAVCIALCGMAAVQLFNESCAAFARYALPFLEPVRKRARAFFAWLIARRQPEEQLTERLRLPAARLGAAWSARWTIWCSLAARWAAERRRRASTMAANGRARLPMVVGASRRSVAFAAAFTGSASARAMGDVGRGAGRVVRALPDAMVRSGLLLLMGGVLGMGLVTYGFISSFDPAPVLAEADQGVVIVDRNDKELFRFAGPNGGFRKSVKLQDVSPWVVKATIAAEDSDFWTNPGINVKGIARAVYENVAFWERGGLGRGSGGSSITQQLARNLYFSEDVRYQRSAFRKAGELLIALSINRRYSKEMILEGYLNQVFYGNHAYGIQAASERYFDKPASQLTLAEAALLAGLPQAPSDYDPLLRAEQVAAEPASVGVNPAAKERQEIVLDMMVKEEQISQEEADAAKTEPIKLTSGRFDVEAPHFVMYVLDRLKERFEPQRLRSGLRVVTTLDLDLQKLGEAAVRDQLAATGPALGATNGSLLALDPRTGEVLAMVGSADYFDPGIDGQVNMTTARRQPGSTFKIFTYTKAFELGLSPSTVVRDVPTKFIDEFGKPYEPKNFDGKYHGLVPIRTAFANSMNLPAVQTIAYTGVPPVVEKARMLGITTLDRDWYGFSLTLGAAEVQLLDLTYAYSVYANNGTMAGTGRPAVPGERPLDPIAILRVEDFQGRTVLEYPHVTKAALSPEVAYLVTDVLSDNKAREMVFGAAMRLPGRPAAVKTGTTEDHRDFWTVGYTPDLAVGVWMGNSNNQPLNGGFSGSTTAPIWTRFMTEALADKTPLAFARPPGIVAEPVCTSTGLAPTRGCRGVTSGLFVMGLDRVVITPEAQSIQPPALPAPRNAAPAPQPKQPDNKKRNRD